MDTLWDRSSDVIANVRECRAASRQITSEVYACSRLPGPHIYRRSRGTDSSELLITSSDHVLTYACRQVRTMGTGEGFILGHEKSRTFRGEEENCFVQVVSFLASRFLHRYHAMKEESAKN